MAKRKKKPSNGQQHWISEKIAELRREGVPEERAVGAAYGMSREGRLSETGAYKRAHPKGTRKSPFAADRARKRSRRRSHKNG